MRSETARIAATNALRGLLPLLGLVVAGCSGGQVGVEGALASALKPIGATEVPCTSSYGGGESSGICFEALTEESLADFTGSLQDALVSADLTNGRGMVECRKLTHLAPSVMGNCFVGLDGRLGDAGFDATLVSVAFSREQMAALEDTGAYPQRYRVVLKVRRTGTIEPASAVAN